MRGKWRHRLLVGAVVWDSTAGDEYRASDGDILGTGVMKPEVVGEAHRWLHGCDQSDDEFEDTGGAQASGDVRCGYDSEFLVSFLCGPVGYGRLVFVSGYGKDALAVVPLPTRPVTARRLRMTSTLFSARRSALGSQSPSGRFLLVNTYSSGSTRGRAVIASSSRAMMCRQK